LYYKINNRMKSTYYKVSLKLKNKDPYEFTSNSLDNLVLHINELLEDYQLGNQIITKNMVVNWICRNKKSSKYNYIDIEKKKRLV
jgi:hypothetical protein